MGSDETCDRQPENVNVEEEEEEEEEEASGSGSADDDAPPARTQKSGSGKLKTRRLGPADAPTLDCGDSSSGRDVNDMERRERRLGVAEEDMVLVGRSLRNGRTGKRMIGMNNDLI